ncbi:hypothetical protein [Rathayibacter sp. AY1C5]|uniref:hypothetical protein n=1 Tax=Rathayibacter sp. AY1C5 TaxID=2080538 RepID=UPI0011B01D97|nr:hypothetical protein [Rathayibacter sp. AY1C5]
MTEIKKYLLSINEGNKLSTLEIFSALTLDEICLVVRTKDWVGFSATADGSQNMVYRAKQIDGILELSQ